MLQHVARCHEIDLLCAEGKSGCSISNTLLVDVAVLRQLALRDVDSNDPDIGSSRAISRKPARFSGPEVDHDTASGQGIEVAGDDPVVVTVDLKLCLRK